jgi:hypothetical protein
VLFTPVLKYVTAGLAIALLIFIGLWKMEQNRAGRLAERNSELVNLRKSDRARYEAAQAEAERRNKETVQKIEDRHEEISDRSRSQYLRDLERLRLQPKANRGSTSGPGVSGVPKATGGVDVDGVPDAPCGDLCASEIELRLMHLQNWVREQGQQPASFAR